MTTEALPNVPPGAPAAARWAQELSAEAFVHLRGGVLGQLFTAGEVAWLSAFWEDLEPDTELPDGGAYRLRRYGRLRVEARGDGYLCTPLPHAAFRQDADVIPAYQGRARLFGPIPEVLLSHPALARLVSFDIQVTGSAGPRWLVGLHMVRVLAAGDRAGKPTPEGRHRDGHDYIGMHLIGRRGCTGGESIIYREGRAPVRCMLAERLDSLIVDDRALTHEVTSLGAPDGVGVRDMLLVDINVDGSVEPGSPA